MEIFETVRECRKHWHTYEEWDNTRQENYARKKYLFNTYKENRPDEYKKLKAKTDTVIRAVNILDNASENAAENMQVATETVSNVISAIPAFLISGLSIFAAFKASKYYDKHKVMPFYFYVATFYSSIFIALTEMPLVFWRTKKQIEASRVARAKSKEEELKDLRNFVVYTPEQTKEAQKTAQSLPDDIIKDEDEKNISVKNAFKATFNMDKEYSRYLKKYRENLGIDKKFQDKLNKNYSKEELSEANKDKELILNAVKEINNNAEKYCENAEAAFETLKMFNILAILPSIYIINKIMNAVFPKANGMAKKLIALYIPIIVTLPINLWMNKKQKEAAKVGRHKMKQELTKDLAPLAYFDDNELKKVSHIKGEHKKLNLWQKTVQNMKFIPKYLKEREEYLEYKTTQKKEDEKLNYALKNISISNEQKKEAKKMQEKVFFVFDEIDEMSQKYSENMEGTIAFGKKVLGLLKAFVLMTALAIPTYILFSGNFHITQIAKKLSDIILNKNSELKKNIDEIYAIAKNDKALKAQIDGSLSLGNIKVHTLLNEPKISKQLQNIIQIINNSFGNKNNYNNFVNKELKNGFISKWFRKLATDIAQLAILRLQKISDTKINSIGDTNVAEILKKLKTTNLKFSNFNTLKLTGCILAVPCILAMVSCSYLLNTFFAYLQKKSGFIGVMRAINKLDNPKYFVSEKDKDNTASGNKNLFAMLNFS